MLVIFSALRIASLQEQVPLWMQRPSVRKMPVHAACRGTDTHAGEGVSSRSARCWPIAR